MRGARETMIRYSTKEGKKEQATMLSGLDCRALATSDTNVHATLPIPFLNPFEPPHLHLSI